VFIVLRTNYDAPVKKQYKRMVLTFVQETQNTHKGHSSELANHKKDCLKQEVQMDVILYYVQEYIQQGRQCTNNITMRCVHATIVAVKK